MAETGASRGPTRVGTDPPPSTPTYRQNARSATAAPNCDFVSGATGARRRDVGAVAELERLRQARDLVAHLRQQLLARGGLEARDEADRRDPVDQLARSCAPAPTGTTAPPPGRTTATPRAPRATAARAPTACRAATGRSSSLIRCLERVGEIADVPDERERAARPQHARDLGRAPARRRTSGTPGRPSPRRRSRRRAAAPRPSRRRPRPPGTTRASTRPHLRERLDRDHARAARHEPPRQLPGAGGEVDDDPPRRRARAARRATRPPRPDSSGRARSYSSATDANEYASGWSACSRL